MRRVPLAVVLLLGLFLVACASAPSGSSSGMAATTPIVSVERFLQAVNTEDLEAMGRIFGTSRGAVAETTGGPIGCAFRRVGSWVGLSSACARWSEIELRMDTIAMILRHNEYEIRSESSVAGRTRPTRRVGVDIRIGQERINNVPFVVVEGRDGRWFVEEIGLERVTNPR